MLVFIYVDDIQIMSETQQVYQRFRDLWTSEIKIRELGKPKHMVSVRVEISKDGVLHCKR
jgi:hypothetical protein